MLGALGNKGHDFDDKDPLKCIVFDVIEELYIAYKVRNNSIIKA